MILSSIYTNCIPALQTKINYQKRKIKQSNQCFKYIKLAPHIHNAVIPKTIVCVFENYNQLSNHSFWLCEFSCRPSIASCYINYFSCIFILPILFISPTKKNLSNNWTIICPAINHCADDRGLSFRRVSQVSRVNRQRAGRRPMSRRPSSIYGAGQCSGANIRGTSFVGRFVLEYHPVPGGGAGGTGGRR